jgi:hypothetical protein
VEKEYLQSAARVETVFACSKQQATSCECAPVLVSHIASPPFYHRSASSSPSLSFTLPYGLKFRLLQSRKTLQNVSQSKPGKPAPFFLASLFHPLPVQLGPRRKPIKTTHVFLFPHLAQTRRIRCRCKLCRLEQQQVRHDQAQFLAVHQTHKRKDEQQEEAQ